MVFSVFFINLNNKSIETRYFDFGIHSKQGYYDINFCSKILCFDFIIGDSIDEKILFKRL